MTGFAEFFAAYWWLLFPLGFFAAAGFKGVMDHRLQRQKMELAKAYVSAGKDVPPGLLDA